MDRNTVEIDGGQILLSLFEKYKNEPWVLSSSEIQMKSRLLFSKWRYYGVTIAVFALKSGVVLESYSYVRFLINSDYCKESRFITLSDIKNTFHIHDSTSIKVNCSKANCYKDSYLIKMSKPEIQFLQEFIDVFSFEVDKKIEYVLNEETKKQQEEKQRLESFKKLQTSLLQELDKDDTGVIDAIEGSDDFIILLKKHQKKVIEVDKQYIQDFVKVSNYLKTKRQKIQDVFSFIKNTKDESELNETVGIIKNQIHTYELILFHSLNMITSIVEDDFIIFYEIYESFDKLNIFNSNWENDVSQQLDNIEDGLSDLKDSIDSMERNIVNGLSELSYVTQEGFSDLERSVTKELKSIDSSIKFNNLLTKISTYQLYNIYKQTKPLLPE